QGRRHLRAKRLALNDRRSAPQFPCLLTFVDGKRLTEQESSRRATGPTVQLMADTYGRAIDGGAQLAPQGGNLCRGDEGLCACPRHQVPGHGTPARPGWRVISRLDPWKRGCAG